MVAIYHTAYPRLKKDLSPHEFGDVYTPTDTELRFAQRHCKRTSASYLGLLVQLKLVQRLGRFATLGEVPDVIVNHIRAHSRSRTSRKELQTYFASGAKIRHVKFIRQYLKIRPFDSETTGALVRDWALEAAATKEALADIINVTLEYLVKEKYELPAFSALDRLCQSARREVNDRYYDQLCGYLTAGGRQLIAQMLRSAGGASGFGWYTLKNEPKRPTPRNIQAYITYLEWLTSLQNSLPIDLGLPPVKHRQFINEAKALDHAELMKLKVSKRTALMIVLIRHQYAQTLDKAAEIVIKLLQKMDRTAEKKLEQYLAHHQKQTDRLIAILSGTVQIYLDKPETVTAFDPVLGKDSKLILQMCEQYMAYAGNNYLPFMVPLYKKQRATLFRTIEILNLASATEDKDILKAFRFILKHKKRRTETLCILSDPDSPSSKNVLNIPVSVNIVVA